MTDGNMEAPRFSRSGRVLKKSIKVREMEEAELDNTSLEERSSRHLVHRPVHCSFADNSQSASGSSELPSSFSPETSDGDRLNSGDRNEISMNSKCLTVLEQNRRMNVKSSTEESEEWGSDTSLDEDSPEEESSDSATFWKRTSTNRNANGGKQRPGYSVINRSAEKNAFEMTVATRDCAGVRNILVAKKRATSVESTTDSKKNLNSYVMWKKENMREIAARYKGLSFGELSKKAGEAWRALPPREKAIWRRKVGMDCLKYPENSLDMRRDAATQSSPVDLDDGHSIGASEEYHGTLGTVPIDVAAHLKLLGDSLTKIGENMMHTYPSPSIIGTYNVMLDSMLCAVGTLLCLAREITGLEHMPDDVFAKILDHIVYFFPGLTD